MRYATKKNISRVLGAAGSHAQCVELRKKVDGAAKLAYTKAQTWLQKMPPSHQRITDSMTMMVENILEDGVPGDIMETGVWTGFMSMVLSAALAAHGAADRDEWLCDSFNGLPKPDASRFPADRGSPFWKLTRHELHGPEVTQANFEALGLRNRRQHWEVGFFNETMPPLLRRVEKLALLRLDGDMFQSTWEVLHTMYPKLQVRGRRPLRRRPRGPHGRTTAPSPGPRARTRAPRRWAATW